MTTSASPRQTRTQRTMNVTTVKTAIVDARFLHATKFTWKDEQKGDGKNVPAHFHAHIKMLAAGLDVHLREGLTPDALGVVRLEVRNRAVTDDRGTVEYLSLNLYPAAHGEAPELRLLIGQHGGGEVIERKNAIITLQTIG